MMEENKASGNEVQKKGVSFSVKLIAAALAVVVVLVLIMVLISTHKTKIDLSKYVTITYSGYNTIGHASAEIDYEKLAADYGEKLEEGLSGITAQLAFYAVATGKLDKTEGLTNGDEITFIWNNDESNAAVIQAFEKNHKLNLVFKNVTEKVSGLENADVYDPFESITLNFSGYSSLGNASIDTSFAKVKNLRYTVSPDSNLSNGDEVTVSVSAPYGESLEDYCMSYGYVPGQKEKTYTVSGLDEIIDYDLFAGLDVSFEGISSIGSVKIDKSGVEIGDISYSVEPSAGLSNGDTVTVTASYNGWYYSDIDSYLANSGYKASATTKTYKVSGLTEADDFDPFEGLSLTFSGTSPYGEAAINTDDVILSDLDYTVSKSRNLSNGEEITITVSGPWGADLENYCLERGYVPTKTEMTYEVEGLSCYVTELEQIPADDLELMDEQIQDTLKARVASGWSYKDSMKNMTFLGCYLLYPKDMDNRDSANYLYLVYKIDVQNEKSGKFSYYYYAVYRDLLYTAEGDLQYDLMNFDTVGNTFTKDSLRYEGFEKLSELYNSCVTARIDRYKYVTDIEE